ncbi:recombinase family protein [Acutalibacter sp. 1XD8-33]|uniref:recombinase family protein n=1 Tax=Acutalibacter sp. 1XD8-33 TaxID=2320081 RepID=UPI0013146951|nr:recombinase family protein [Acutalibacter sp. 1XD8-33]
MTVTDISREPQKPEVIRLAAYCRVSSKSADQLHSFAAQIRYYKDYERKNPQYKLVDVYADEGLSGMDMKKRDEQNRLIRDCKLGKIDRVITKSVSRFARNTQELLVALRTFKELGVSIYFEEQGIDSEKMNMEMLVTFPGMAAQQESVNISDHLRRSYQMRMESGEFNCCAPAYGYDLVDGQLVVKEDEAKIIRRIFDLYLQGIGKQNIANILNAEGVPRRYAQKKWYHNTINYVINNERYMGDALLQKKFTTDTLPFKKKKNRGEMPQYYVENSNPPIVSKEIYMAAQELQKSRNVSHKRESVHLLTGVLRCPECGRSFRRLLLNGTAYWLCSGKAAGATDCQSRRVRETAVYDTFCLMVDKLSFHRQNLLGTLIRQLEMIQNHGGESQEKIRQIDKQIADLSAQNLVVARLHTNGVLNATDFAAQSSVISNKINDLRLDRKKARAEDEDDELIYTLKSLDDTLAAYVPGTPFSQALFDEIIQSITVVDNARLTFHLVGGLAFTEQIPENARCRTA